MFEIDNVTFKECQLWKWCKWKSNSVLHSYSDENAQLDSDYLQAICILHSVEVPPLNWW